MKKHVDLNVPVNFEKIKEYQVLDTRFIQCKIFLMHLGENLNGSIFEKSVVENAIPTLANTPILAYIEENKEGEEDFSDHRQILEIKNNEIRISYKGKAIGVIPETNDAHFEMRVCDDCVEREFLTCMGLLWTKFDDSVDIFNRDENKQESMELHDDYTGHFNKDNYFVFDSFKFYGACALGEDVQPAMRSASIDTVFSMNEIQTKLEQFTNYLQNQSLNEVDINTNTNMEGGREVLNEELKNSILQEFSLTFNDINFEITDEMSEEDLRAKLEEFTKGNDGAQATSEPEAKVLFSATYRQKREALDNALSSDVIYDADGNLIEETYYWVADFDDTYVYVEQSHWTKDGGYDEKHGRYSYSFDEENITATISGDFEEMILVWLTVEENQKIKEERGNYESLQTEFDNYKEKYSTPINEVQRLQEFETKTLSDKRELDETELFSQFDEELSSMEEYSTLKEKAKEFSIEALSEKLFALLGKKNAAFSVKKKETETVKIQVPFETKDTLEDPYGGLLAKVYNK